MATITKLQAVQEWLVSTEGWIRLQATDGEGQPVTAEDILRQAERCQWAFPEDMSELLYAKQGVMHPMGLEIGWGDKIEAYKYGNTDRFGVLFFNAYQP